MELVHEMAYQAMLGTPMRIGAGPTGSRVLVDVVGGLVEGPRIRGTLKGAGGDWALVASDGFSRLDVRIQIETDDGAFVYVQYHGLLELNATVKAAMKESGGTEYADQYFRTAPRFETGDERYAWLNQSVFVGEGRLIPESGVEYRVYRLT